MALTLNQVREQYPELSGTSDEVLVNFLHKNYYSDIPLEDFSKAVGLTSGDEAGDFRSYVELPFLKGTAAIGGAVGYGLEASGIAPETGRSLQESHQRAEEALTERQSQQAREDASKRLIDDEGNYGGYNAGTFAQQVFESAPGMLAMGMPGGLLARGATAGAKAAGVGSKAANTIGSALGFGASEGIFSGASNAEQIQQEIRNASFDKLVDHPAFIEAYHTETDPDAPQEQRLEQARDILARKAGDEVFADTAVKTGGISALTGGGIFGMLREGRSGGLLANAGKGMLKEGVLQEAPQSALEQRTSNQARLDYLDPNQDLNKGVLTAGIEGGLVGAAMGVAGGAGVRDIGKAETVDDAIAAAGEALKLPAPTPGIGFDRSAAMPKTEITFSDGSTIDAHQYFQQRKAEHGDEERARNETYQALNGKPEPAPIGLPELVFTADGRSLNKAELIKSFIDNGATERQANDYIAAITTLPVQDRTQDNLLDVYRYIQAQSAQERAQASGLLDRNKSDRDAAIVRDVASRIRPGQSLQEFLDSRIQGDSLDAERRVAYSTKQGMALQQFLDAQTESAGYVPGEAGQVWEAPNIEAVDQQAQRNRAFYEAEQAAIARKEAELDAMLSDPRLTPNQQKQYRKARVKLEEQKRQRAADFKAGIGYNIIPNQAGTVQNTQLRDQLQGLLARGRSNERTGSYAERNPATPDTSPTPTGTIESAQTTIESTAPGKPTPYTHEDPNTGEKYRFLGDDRYQDAEGATWNFSEGELEPLTTQDATNATQDIQPTTQPQRIDDRIADTGAVGGVSGNDRNLSEQQQEPVQPAASGDDTGSGSLDSILTTKKQAWINARLKEQQIKPKSPGYGAKFKEAGEAYEQELNKALAKAPFDVFANHPVNSGVPKGDMLKQAHEALRDEFGVADEVPKSTETIKQRSSNTGAWTVEQRKQNAANSFKESVIEQFGLSDDEAQKAFDYYLRNKLIKLNSGTGQFNLSDGRLWDASALKKAAKDQQKPDKQAKNKTAINDGDDILTAIAKLGGLNAAEAKAQGIDPASFGLRGHGIKRVFNHGKNSKSYDSMAEALREQGFDVPMANDLVELVSGAVNQGRKIYTAKGAELQAEIMAQEHVSEQEAQHVLRIESLYEAAKQHDADFGTNYLEIILKLDDLSTDNLSEWEQDLEADRKARQQKTDSDSQTPVSGEAELESYTEQEIADREREQDRLAKQEKIAEINAKQKEKADKEIDTLADEMLGNLDSGDVFSVNTAPNAYEKDTEQTENKTDSKTASSADREKQRKSAAKLRSVAQKALEQAKQEQSRDRVTNTPKRAREAGYAINNALANEALAKTALNIADALERGEAGTLAGLSSKAQVEQINNILKAAMGLRDAKRFNSYAEQQKHEGRKPEPEDIAFAKYPVADMHPSHVPKFHIELREIRGGKKLSASIHGGTINHDQYAQLKKLVGEKKADDMLGWFPPEQLKRQTRLKRMGINNQDELESALADFLKFKEGMQAEDKVKAAERALVGQKLGVDFFPTPKTIADKMIELAGIEKGMRVLEPSAGNGNLADAAKEAGATVDVIEISDALRNVLDAKGYKLVGRNFNDFEPDNAYDAIVMNPPFSNGQDAEHIERAYGMLKPGGRLVAIAGEGVFFRSDAKSKAFREWLDENDAEVEKLPEKTFQDKTLINTTGVNARLVVIEKPLSKEATNDIKFSKNNTEKNDTETGQFLDGRAKPVRRGVFDGSGEGVNSGRPGTERAGEATTRQGVLDQSTVSSESSERSGVLEHVLHRDRALDKDSDLGSASSSKTQPKGTSADELRSWLPKRVNKLVEANKLHIVQSAREIPDNAQAFEAAGAEAFYKISTDELFMIADNITKENFKSVLNHELFHRLEFTDKRLREEIAFFDNALEKRFNLAAKGGGSKLEKAAYRRVMDAHVHESDYLTEFKAYLVSEYSRNPDTFFGAIKKIIQDFIAAIRAAMIRVGVPVQMLTPADLTALAKYGARVKDGVSQSSNSDIHYSRAAQDSATVAAAKRKAGLGPKRTLAQSIQDIISLGWSANAQALKERWQALKPQLEQGVFDKFLGIKLAEQEILGEVAHSQSGYIGARLSTGSSSTMQGLLLFGSPEWRDGIIQKKAESKGFAEILQPVKDDIENFTAWMVGRRADRLFREGKENNFTRAEIDALLALKQDSYQGVADDIAAMNKAVLDLAQESGLVDAQSRRLFEHSDYIPFFRLVEGVQKGPRNKQGLSHQTSGIKVLKGGENPLSDPLGNMMQNWAHLIDASMKNDALNKTLTNLEGSRFVEPIPRVEFKQAMIPKEQIRKLMQEAGLPDEIIDAMPGSLTSGIAKLWAMQAPTDPDVVRVMRDGKSEYFRVHDGMLLTSLTAVNQSQLGGIFKSMRYMKHLLTAAITADPTFMARNFIRDSMHSWTIAEEKGFKLGLDSFHGAIKSMKEEGGYVDMMFAGASFQGGYGNYNNPDSARESMDAALRRRGIRDIQGFHDSILDTPKKYWEMYRSVGDAIENANREAILENAKRSGAEKAQYLFEAKDIMDFSMQGSFTLIRAMSDMLPFFNARLVGLYRLAKAGKTDQARRLIIAKGLSISFMTLAMLALNSDNEDYEALEDFDKDQYWHFFIGDQHYRIPKPFELGLIFGTVPERAARAMIGKDTLKDFGKRMAHGASDTLAFNPVPQLFKPFVELYSNKNMFTGRPIEGMADEGKLPSARYNEYTSETMRVLSSVLPESLGASPKRLEHLMSGYLGAMGMYALGVSDMMVRSMADMPELPEQRIDRLPVIKGFYQEQPALHTKYGTQLYEMLSEVNQIHRTINAYKKEGNIDKARELLQENASKLRSRKALDKSSKSLSEIRKRIDAIYRSDLGAEEKRRRIDALMMQANKGVQRVVRATSPYFN